MFYCFHKLLTGTSLIKSALRNPHSKIDMAERVGFEPTVELLAPQLLSRQLPSTDSATSPYATNDINVFIECRKTFMTFVVVENNDIPHSAIIIWRRG